MTSNPKNQMLVAILMILAGTLVIFGNSLTDVNGFLSPDSTNYLRLAENIVASNGFNLPNNGRYSAESVHFAVWPIGYPSLIALIAKVFSISTFLSSKFLNALLLSISILAFFREFGRNGTYIATILLSAGTINNFSMTWSEAPFTMFLVLISIQLGAMLSGGAKVGFYNCFILFILAFSAFLSRYIGIFTFGPIAICSLLLFTRGRKNDALKTIMAGSCALILAIGYLAYNKYTTGYATGMLRIPAPESNIELLHQLTVSIVRELVLPLVAWNPHSAKHNMVVIVFAILVLMTSLRLISAGSVALERKTIDYIVAFFTVGFLYLSAIILFRWNIHFDSFSYRLIDPAFVLFFSAFFLYLLEKFRNQQRVIAFFLLASAAMSIMTHAYAIASRINGPGYFDATRDRVLAYSSIPEGSIVLFGGDHLRYLRPFLHIAHPKSRLYYAGGEPIGEFLSSLDKTRQIFIETDERAFISTRYHESVQQFLIEFPPGEIVQLDTIRRCWGRSREGAKSYPNSQGRRMK